MMLSNVNKSYFKCKRHTGIIISEGQRDLYFKKKAKLDLKLILLHFLTENNVKHKKKYFMSNKELKNMYSSDKRIYREHLVKER